MRVLFIGGTGIISSACSPLALVSGIDLYLMNRGQSHRGVPSGAIVLNADIRDFEAAKAAIGDLHFDVVVDWIAFTVDHIEQDLRLFQGRTGQFVFISSASAYQKPIVALPITESTTLANPYWGYSRNKIACEERLMKAFREDGFPITIVRPSHTYDKTLLPFDHGYTVVDRMRRGKPVVVHGDGTSLWVLTHHHDFAKAFVPLLGNSHAIGDAIHITSDEVLTWNQIYEIVARAAGVTPKLVHVPSEVLATYDANWGSALIGDKANSVIFDNSKVKRLVPGFAASIPFDRGAREIMEWFDADSTRRTVDPKADALQDSLVEAIGKAHAS